MDGASFITNQLKNPIWHTLDKFCPHIFTNCSPFFDDCFFWLENIFILPILGTNAAGQYFTKYFQLGFDPENWRANQSLVCCLI